MLHEQDLTLLTLKMGDGPQAEECGQPPEGAKGKEMDSPLEPPEGKQSC